MSYLLQVRTDSSSISEILTSHFQQALEETKEPLEEQQISSKFDTYFLLCNMFLYVTTDQQKAIDYLKSQTQSKGVCAKTLKAGQIAWKCEDCEKDPTCIICQECFEKGDHKGHKVWLKRNVSGCCDCGDPDAWDPAHFCSDHKGYEASSEAALESLPLPIRNSAPYVFGELCKQIKQCSLNLQAQILPDSTSIQELQDKIRYQILIDKIFQFFDKAIEASPAFIHYITEALIKPYTNKVISNCRHTCCIRWFVDENHKLKYDKEVVDDDTIENAQKFKCFCTTLDLTLITNSKYKKDLKKVVYEFYFKLFQSLRFKQALGLSFAANIKPIYQGNMQDYEYRICSIGVQVLTIDEISLSIMKTVELRQNIVNYFTEIVTNLQNQSHEQQILQTNKISSILYDIKYMAKCETLKYVFKNTGFLQDLLRSLVDIYFLDKIEQRTEHVIFDQSLFKQHLFNLEIQLIKTFKTYFKEIDYHDKVMNQDLMNTFIECFAQIDKRMTIECNKTGIFVIPLHRIFSFYFTRLVMINYFQNSNQNINFITQSNSYAFYQVVQQYVSGSKDQIQEKLNTIIRPLARSWGFIHEIMSGKWILSGYAIQQLPSILYEIFEYYLLLDISLIQMLICTSPSQDVIIQHFLGAQSTDLQLTVLTNQIIQNNINEEDFVQFKPLFDVAKLKQTLHWQLRSLIDFYMAEISYIYSLQSKNSIVMHAYNEKYMKKIDEIYKGVVKREIIHNLIQNEGKADVATIKEASEKIFVDNEFFEGVLLEVASVSKDTKGKVTFKLVDENLLKQFDQYYFLNPHRQAKCQEAILKQYKDSPYLNSIVGDYKNFYQYQTKVNKVIAQAFANSNLIQLVTQIIVIWSNRSNMGNFEKNLFDEQIYGESLKLLLIILEDLDSVPMKQQAHIWTIFKDNDYKVIKSLKQLTLQNDEMTQIVTHIFKKISQINPKDFEFVQQEILQLDDKLNFMQESAVSQVISNDQSQVETSSKDIKQLSQLKKQKMLDKFKSSRQEYIKKNDNSVMPELQRRKSEHISDVEEIECSICKGTLSQESFLAEPYGSFAYVQKTNLMYMTLKQTIHQQDEGFKNQAYSNWQQNHSQEEEKKESSGIISKNLFESLDINYLEEETQSGAVLIKCSHQAHQKCLNNYLITNESTAIRGDIRKVLGLGMKTYQCPLCKQIANTLLPSGSLSDIKTRDEKNYNKQELLEFFINMISTIVKKQNNRKQDILTIDIQKKPKIVLDGIQQFIEHRIQLIDLKGLNEYLQKSRNSAGIQEYADILSATYNILSIIIEGPGEMSQSEDEMEITNSQSLFQSQLNNICKLFVDNWEEKFYLLDLSSLAMQIMFYVQMMFHEDSKMGSLLMFQTVKCVYQALKIQSIIRLAFYQANGNINGKAQDIIQQLSPEQLQKLAKDPQNLDQLIQSQLPFLRKIAAYVATAQIPYLNLQNKQFNQENQSGINLLKKLRNVNDDAIEFEILTEYLGLQHNDVDLHNIFTNDQDNLGDSTLSLIENKTGSIKILFECLESIQSKDLLRERVVKYSMGLLESVTGINYAIDVNLIKNSMTSFKFEMPDQMKILTTYFKFNFISLPSNYQEFVQEYYKKKCKNCNTQVKENLVCLLCGDIVCWLSACCKHVEGMKPNEGELTFHSRIHEAGTSLFISTHTGQIVLINDERSAEKSSPYLNKFGEAFDKYQKKWDNFYIDQEGGGLQYFEELRKMIVNFTIANEIIQIRSDSQQVWRLGMI